MTNVLTRLARLEQWAWGKSMPAHLETVVDDGPGLQAGGHQDIMKIAGEVCLVLGLPSTPANVMPIANSLVAERDRCKRLAHKIGKAEGSAPCIEVAIAIVEGRQP